MAVTGRALAIRLGLVLVILEPVVTSVWAYLAPQSWYVTLNQRVGLPDHYLISDSAAGRLALVVLVLAALVSLDRTLVLGTFGAWTAVGVLHAIAVARFGPHTSPVLAGTAVGAFLPAGFLSYVLWMRATKARTADSGT